MFFFIQIDNFCIYPLEDSYLLRLLLRQSERTKILDQNQVAFELNHKTPSFIEKKKYFNLNEFAISDFVLFSATYTLSLTLCSPTGTAFFCG